MKYAVIWDFYLEDLEKLQEKQQTIQQDHKQNPDKYPTYLRLQDGTRIAFSMIGHAKGISHMEADTEDQLRYAVQAWEPELRLKFIPIRPNRRRENSLDTIFPYTQSFQQSSEVGSDDRSTKHERR